MRISHERQVFEIPEREGSSSGIETAVGCETAKHGHDLEVDQVRSVDGWILVEARPHGFAVLPVVSEADR